MSDTAVIERPSAGTLLPDQQHNQTRPPRQPVAIFALAGPLILLIGLIVWAALTHAGRPGFLELLVLLMLPLATPAWPGSHRVERLLRGGASALALAAIGLAMIRVNASMTIATGALLILFLLTLAIACHLGLPPRAAYGALAGVAALLAALLFATPAATILALDQFLRLSLTWTSLALALVGLTLFLLIAGRGWHPLIYLLISLGLTAGWAWADLPTQINLFAKPGALEIGAATLLVPTQLTGTAAMLLLTILLPSRRWSAAARADLCAHLVVLALPLTALLLPFHQRLAVEHTARVAWLALVFIALLALRTIVGFPLAIGTAHDWWSTNATARPRAAGTRLALALLVLCLALYWPAARWRAGNFGLVGDEPSYLAATMSLWKNGNLDLASSFYSDELTALIDDLAGERAHHAYEDESLDRLTLAAPLGVPRQSLYLPVVAGMNLRGTILLVNPGRETAGVELTLYNEAGAAAGRQTIVLAAEGTATVAAPATTSGWLAASLSAAKPMLAAVRLDYAGAGTETIDAGTAIARQCIPIASADRSWQQTLLVQNTLPTAATGTWEFRAITGERARNGQFTIAASGVTAVPLDLPDGPGAICLAADGPVTSAFLAHSAPGLIVQGPGPAQEQSIDIPDWHTAFADKSQRLVLLYATSTDQPSQVTVVNTRTKATTVQEVPPRGTAQLAFDDISWRVSLDQPAIAAIQERVSSQVAGLTLTATPATTLYLPAIDMGTDLYALSQIELVNAGPTPTMAVLTLQDATGETIWSDKIWVCARCAVSKPFWYRAPHSRLLTITTAEPLTATLLQREIRLTRPYHSIGLSLALLPGYALASFQGVLATIALISALLALASYGLLCAAGIVPSTALLIAAIVAFASPLATAATRLYAETGGMFCLVLALLAIEGWRQRRSWWLLPCCLFCLIGAGLFHSRLLPAALIIGLSFLALIALRLLRRNHSRTSRSRWQLALIGGGSLVLLAALVLVAMTIEPRLRPTRLGEIIDFTYLPSNGFGILFDRATGLFPAIPVLLLAGGGFFALIRRTPYLGWTTLAVVVTQWLVVASRVGGWEVWGPPGRYIMPAVPLLGLALGAAWQWGPGWFFRLPALALAGWGWLVGLCAWWMPLSLHSGAGPNNLWFTDDLFQSFLGNNPLWIFPQATSYDLLDPIAIVLWCATLAVGTLLGLLHWRRTRPAPDCAEPSHDQATPRPSN